MSFVDVIDQLVEAAETEGSVSYARAMIPSVIRAGVLEGYSGAVILNSLREAGLGIQTQRFYSMLGNIKAGIEAGEDIGTINLTELPDESMFQDWEVTRGSGYVYQMQFHYQRLDELGGVMERGSIPFSIRSSLIVTPEEALTEAFSILQQGGQQGTDIVPVIGGEITGLYRMVGE